MKAVVFLPADGSVTVDDIPPPQCERGHVLVCNQFSLLSAGTERARLEVGRETLVGKARRRPDQVRKVLESVRQVGIADTWSVVKDRLSTPGLTGYSSAGSVLEVGASVDGILPGQLVACAGGGYANHAEVVSVPKNLCAVVPVGVQVRDAAFSTLGAIALRGIHQASVEPGSRIVVIGLGLVGQLTIRLLDAYGYSVAGVDRDEAMVALAHEAGIEAWGRSHSSLVPDIQRHLGGSADAVIVAAAATSADPLELAGGLARDRATVVVVGDSTVAPNRDAYYHKELTIAYSRSYGPGRYDLMYEEGGIAYPEGFVPFDERRNLTEFLRLVAAGRIDLDTLHPIVFPVEQAPEAYTELLAPSKERKVAILLSYGPMDTEVRAEHARAEMPSPVPPTRARQSSQVRIASVGAGSFASRRLLPPLSRDHRVAFSWISSARGLSATQLAKRFGFARAVGGLEEGLSLGDTDAVLVVTRHDSHASLTSELLNRQLPVFCEKPLALSEDELEDIVSAQERTGVPLMVGFNRRFAPSVRRLKALLPRESPIQISYRVFAGKLPSGHWYFESDQGGRILGEVCHFVDTAIWLAGSPPVAVSAASDVMDPISAQSVTAVIEHANGSSSTVVYGGCTPTAAPKESIEVAADDLAARIDDFQSLQVWGPKAVRMRFRRGPKGHGEEMGAFVDLVRGGTSPEADMSVSLWSTLATLRIFESVQTRERLRVSPATPALSKALGKADQIGVF